MTHTIRRTALVVAALLLAVAPASARPAGAEDSAHPSRALFVRYCASCHGTQAEGGGIGAGSLSPMPPALDHLEQRYGSPLPKAALLALAVDPRRHGGARICGRRPGLPTGHATWMRRRGIVLAVLDYLQSN